jgi:hypothetical protein
MSLGSARRALISAAIAVAIIAPTIAWLLYDVVNAPTPLATRLVAAAYPVLDVGLVVPALVLIDQTRHLRGGVLWSGWVLLLAGALSMAVGDIAFAWFEVLGLDALDPILDFAFGAAYVLWAWGVFAHRRALASD